jgi:hypothetical protein
LTIAVPEEADIDQIERLVVQAGRHAMGATLELACREVEQATTSVCPHCAGTRGAWDGVDPRVLSTSFGRVVLARRRWRCHDCRRRSRPADRLFRSLGSGTTTAALRAACVRVGSQESFAPAARTLRQLCGARVSPEQVRQLTLAAGAAAVTRQADETRRLVYPTAAEWRAEVAAGVERTRRGQRPVASAPPPARLLVELDGGWVPSREQAGGMEGKVAVLASGTRALGPGRASLWPRRYVASFGSAQTFGEHVYAVAARLGGTEAAEQVVVSDGAGWIKQVASTHFPAALGILDWSHLTRALHKAIRAARPGGQRRAERRELHQRLGALAWQGQIDALEHGLVALRVPGEEVAALESAIRYLTSQRAWLGNYQAWQHAGYPIGSGAVERGVEVVINRRLAGRGRRWCRDNADAVLALRVDDLNRDWDRAHAPSLYSA